MPVPSDISTGDKAITNAYNWALYVVDEQVIYSMKE